MDSGIAVSKAIQWTKGHSLPKSAKKKASKKKPTRKSTRRPLPTKKPKTTKGCHPTDEVKLRGLAVYYITGSTKTAADDVGYSQKTIYEWLKNPKMVEVAKKKANEFLDARCSEIVDLAHRGIVEKINTSVKRKEVSPEAMNRILGTALDKLMTIRELNKSVVKNEFDQNKPLRIVWKDENAKSG